MDEDYVRDRYGNKCYGTEQEAFPLVRDFEQMSALLAEVEELRKDRVRLDYLLFCYARENFQSRGLTHHLSSREAIDTAMSEEHRRKSARIRDLEEELSRLRLTGPFVAKGEG